MNEPIDRQVEQVIQRIKDNPVHMRKHVERVKKMQKKSRALEHLTAPYGRGDDV